MMQTDSEGTYAIDDFDTTLIPVEILPCEVAPRSRGADASSIVELGKQLLLNARNGDTDMVRDLMCRGAPFTTDWLGTSALHLAAQYNHIETAEVLLRAGISRDARTKVDRTPLHMAAYEGHQDMVQLLLNYGAEVDSRDMLRMTPLHWAAEKQHLEVMLILLEHGADSNCLSKFDKTPVTLALEHQRLDMVELLQQEREIVNIQQSQLQAAELETATQNLLELEAARQREEQVRFELEAQQQKQKLAQLISNSTKKKMVFQKIKVHPISDDVPMYEEQQRLQEKIIQMGRKKHRDVTNLAGVEQPLKLLQAHGITMIPVDNDTTIVENAMESGQTVVLTEAGKLALNLTRSSPINTSPMKRLHMNNSRRGAPKKVITIRADQIFGQNSQTVTSKGPNILKRPVNEVKSTGKIFLTSVGNTATTTIPTLTATKVTASPVKKKLITPKTEPIYLNLEDEMEEMFEEECDSLMDVEELNRKLAEVRREAEEYRRQLQKKEEEAEIYKQQLKNIAARRAMMK